MSADLPMTIKELCTKVREAAEAIPGITPWQSVPAHVAEGPSQVRVRTPSEDWLLCELPGDGYAHYIATANPAAVLALLGHIDRLERDLSALAGATVSAIEGERHGAPLDLRAVDARARKAKAFLEALQ